MSEGDCMDLLRAGVQPRDIAAAIDQRIDAQLVDGMDPRAAIYLRDIRERAHSDLQSAVMKVAKTTW